jgi:transposase
VTWRTVAAIVGRVTRDRLQGLGAIGADELNYRERHRYFRVLVEHDRGDIIWPAKRRRANALAELFERLGEDGCAAIESVTMGQGRRLQEAGS